MRIFLLIGLVLAAGIGCASRHSAEEAGKRAIIHYDMATAAYERGDLIPALGATFEALELEPKFLEAQNLLGLIYFRQQKYQQAEEAFKAASALDGRRSEVWNNLGTLYYDQKRYSEALAAFDKALENPLYLYPERVYNNRGLVFEAMGRREEAVGAFRKAIEYGRGIYLPSQNLGRLYFKEGEIDRAESLMQEAARLCAECAEPRFYLGEIYLKRGDDAKAEAQFKQGAAVDPTGYYGELCRRRLLP